MFAITLSWPGEDSVSGRVSKAESQSTQQVLTTAVTAHETSRGPFFSLEGLEMLSLS